MKMTELKQTVLSALSEKYQAVDGRSLSKVFLFAIKTIAINYDCDPDLRKREVWELIYSLIKSEDYKVITQKVRWFADQLDIELDEEVIKNYCPTNQSQLRETINNCIGSYYDATDAIIDCFNGQLTMREAIMLLQNYIHGWYLPLNQVDTLVRLKRESVPDEKIINKIESELNRLYSRPAVGNILGNVVAPILDLLNEMTFKCYC